MRSESGSDEIADRRSCYHEISLNEENRKCFSVFQTETSRVESGHLRHGHDRPAIFHFYDMRSVYTQYGHFRKFFSEEIRCHHPSFEMHLPHLSFQSGAVYVRKLDENPDILPRCCPPIRFRDLCFRERIPFSSHYDSLSPCCH